MISYAQNFEDVMLARVFRGRTEGFYVDIGAMDPVKHSVTKHFYDLGWHGINVEPNPEFYAKLLASRPRDRNFPCCISDQSEAMIFHLVGNEGHSTLDADIADRLEGRLLPHSTIPVFSRTLAEVLAEASPLIDFLKVDVEGWEWQVLRSNNWAKHRPSVVLVEALDPVTLAPSWASWDPELTNHGYKFVYFDGLNRFYIRADREDLETCFLTPPNVFDNIELAPVLEIRREDAQLVVENIQEEDRLNKPVSTPTTQTHSYPSYAQTGEDRILHWLFETLGSVHNLKYVDVGAAIPAGHNNTYLFYTLGGSGVLVEADPGHLNAYATTRPRDIVEQVAIVPQRLRLQNQITFHAMQNPGWSTVFDKQVHLRTKLDENAVKRTFQVPCLTINELLEKHFPNGSFDILSIDIEGLEDEVLAELDLVRFRPKAIVIEHRLDSKGRMTAAGYRLFSSTFINSIYVRADCLEAPLRATDSASSAGEGRMKRNIRQLQTEVTEAGFRPAPLATVLWTVRRLIWPFIRQYHFYHVEQSLDTEERIDRLTANLEELWGALDESKREVERLRADAVAAGKLEERLREELMRLTVVHVDLRSDLAAVINRQSVLAEDVKGLTGAGLEKRHLVQQE